MKRLALIAVAAALYVMATLMIPAIARPLLLVIPTSLFGIAQGINLPSLMTLLTTLAPTEQRGVLMSVNGMVFRLGQTLGPMVMGALFGLSGFWGVFIGGAATLKHFSCSGSMVLRYWVLRLKAAAWTWTGSAVFLKRTGRRSCI